MIVNESNASNVKSNATRRGSALHMVQSSRLAQRLARWLLVAMLVFMLAAVILPWQQTSRGKGQVVAYVPQERQQTIQSPIKGVVAQVAQNLVEGSQVRKGQFILEIQPVAANLVEQLEGQRRELEIKLESAKQAVKTYQDNFQTLENARDLAVEAADRLVDSAKEKLSSKQELLSGYQAKQLQAKLNLDRQKKLSQEGVKPIREIEQLEMKWAVAQSELESIQKDIKSLQFEVTAKEKERDEKRASAQAKVDLALAKQQEWIGKAANERKLISEIDVKLEELSRLRITAPRDGTIFRMPIYERGQTVKEGEAMLTIVPDITQKAVELLVPGNDMPLVQVGQEVRLQFEGWPAVQFAAWPSIAVGTFSGKVTTVDATDNGKGKFRILVVPNEAEDEQAWPSERFLRQGVRVNGWVMLKRVTLGYEIWRQLNGFPVFVSDQEPQEQEIKVPKLPK